MDLHKIEEEMDYEENVRREIERLDRAAWTAAVVLACIVGMFATVCAAMLW